MYPILWQTQGIIIASWYVCYLLAGIASWFHAHHLRKAIDSPLSQRQVDDIYIIAYVAGFYGARWLSILIEHEYQESGFSWKAFLYLGSMTLYGGIIAATVLVLIYAHRKRLQYGDVANVFLPPLLLGIAIGRIGCFLNGDDYGIVAANPEKAWFGAMIFPNLGDDLARYPVQLWESAICFFWALLLSIKRFPGFSWAQRGDFGILAYASSRIFLEMYRGDERGFILVPWLSTSQAISIAVIVSWCTYRGLSSKGPKVTFQADL